MRRAAETAAVEREGRLSGPSFWPVLMTGLPAFLREGFIPLGLFYAGLRLDGLAAGIVASTVASVLVYLYERRAGRDALLVRISLGIVLVQSVIGLAAHSATVYLAQPVLIAAAWGFAFLGSVAIGRPLAGSLAHAWYPFPRWLRESAEFKRVYGFESIVWGTYFLVRSAIRLAMLLHGSLESFLLVTFLTGTPAMLLLLAWSVRYALRGLAHLEAPAACLTPSERTSTLAGEHTFVPAIDPEVSSMLTGRQQEIWKYLTDYVDEHGYPPTVREIGEAVGLASPSTVHAHLANLERAGLIKRDPTKPRALELRRDPKPVAAQAADIHRLPLLGEIAAGGPLLADQNVDEYLAVPEPLARGGEEFLLRVKGDSMIDAGILEGDLVVVRRAQTARDGEIVVALAGDDETADEATVKRFFRENGRVRLQPENDELEPIYADHVQILGVVTGVFRTL